MMDTRSVCQRRYHCRQTDAGEPTDVRLWGIDASERAALQPGRLADSAEDRLGTVIPVGGK